MSVQEILRTNQRLSRIEFFIGKLIVLSASILLYGLFLTISTIIGLEITINFIIIGMIIITNIILSLKVDIGRLHDLEKSGWYVFLQFIPLVNIALNCMLLFKKGTKGKNKYGVDSEIYSQKSHFFITSDAITTGWKFTKKYFWIIILLIIISYIPSLVSNLFSMIVNYIPGATEMVWNEMQQMEVSQPTGPRSIAITIVFAITSFFGARLGLGLIKTNFIILKDHKPTIKDLCVPLRYVLRLIGGGILVGLATLIGFIALIIPGIYISIRMSMFKYFIAEGYGAIDAIKASWAITEGNVWKLIGISFVYLGIGIAGVLALVFGLLWAIPTIILAQTYVYTQLKHNLPDTIKPIH